MQRVFLQHRQKNFAREWERIATTETGRLIGRARTAAQAMELNQRLARVRSLALDPAKFHSLSGEVIVLHSQRPPVFANRFRRYLSLSLLSAIGSLLAVHLRAMLMFHSRVAHAW
jgi:hypothetical protein